MARLTIVVDVDGDPTLEDPEEVADRLIDWDHVQWRGPDAPEVAGAHWPWTRDQLRARLLESFPGRTPADSDVVQVTVGELLDAIESVLNPPWET